MDIDVWAWKHSGGLCRKNGTLILLHVKHPFMNEHNRTSCRDTTFKSHELSFQGSLDNMGSMVGIEQCNFAQQ